MAIDDNTSYELTGAQVKDLASKINAKEDSADLAAVAESGSYNDLLDKPTIPAAQVNSDWDAASGVAQILNKPSLATVATSGSYNDLSNKPTIGNATITIQKNGTSAGTFTTNATSNKSINITVPTATSDLTNDSGFITGIPTASTTTLGGIKVGDNLSIDASGVLSADAQPITVDSDLSTSSSNPVQNSVITTALNRKNKTIWTAYNISPSTNMPASWKAALDGEGIYWTWYDTANTFTNQPAKYGLLRTVIGAGDVRQDFYVQTSGQHYYRTGNATGWYGTSGDSGVFRYLGSNIDSALSTTSNNPVQNQVVTTALSEKVNCKRSYTTATTLNYKKITVVGGTYSTDGAGIILFTREERYIIDGMCASGYGGKCIELGTNHNASNTSATTSNRWVNVKVYGVPDSRTTEIYCRMSPYTYVDVHSSGTITITDIDEATWTAATNNSTYIPLLDEGPGSYWGTCTTGAATAAKVVTVSAAQNFRLEVGAMVTFKAPNTNTAQNPTINVNSTGAKPIFFDNAVITTGSLNKAGQNGRPATYIYDGTNWVWVSWSKDDNTTYSTMSVSEGTTGTATSARTMRADYLKQIIKHYTPTVNNATLTVTQNGTSVGTFTANSSTDTTLALTDTTYSDMTGATSSTAGAHGLVPAPSAGDEGKYLKGDGTWGGEATIRLLADPMSSDSVNITDNMTAALPTSQLYFSALFSDDVKRVVYQYYDMDAGNFTSYKYYTIVNKYTDTTSNSGTCTLVDDSGTTIILSGSLGSTTAAKTITVTRPMNSEEVIYNYTQASNSSANVDVDAPIDLTTYKEIRIVAFDISTNNGTWMTFTPMDSSKSPRTTYLHGYEVIGSAISAVSRADTQCGAVSIGANGVGGVETIIERGGVNDWSAFQTHGFGEGSVQSVGGLIKASASGTVYVRVRLVSPKAGSRVTVYGKR